MDTETEGPSLTPSDLRLLQVAASSPGRRLRRVSIDRQYATLREASARLRALDLLYPAKPAVLLVRPDWEERQELIDGLDLHQRIVELALADPGIAQNDAVDALEGHGTVYQITAAIKSLRKASRVLHPWDGLVLTAAGVEEAKRRGYALAPQLGQQPRTGVAC